MSIEVESQHLVTAGKPFKIVLTTDAPANVDVSLARKSNGAKETRKFALRWPGHFEPPAESHSVNVDGDVECSVEDWGAATAGDKFEVSGKVGTEVATDTATVG